MGSARLRTMCGWEQAWIFSEPPVASQSGKEIFFFFFFPYLGAEQICYREFKIAMETVLILAVLQLMPTPRVQGWVRAQGSGEGEWPERVRAKAQNGQLITKPWEEAAEI